MELKQGYKNTEVGKIPINWDIDLLENLTKVIDPHPSHRAPKSVDKGIPFLGIGDLNENGQIIKEKFRRVDEQIFEEHKLRYDLRKDLIGLGRVASIGKVIKLKNNIGKYTLSPTLGVLDSIGINKGYLYYILNSEYIKSYFSKIMSGSTRSSVGMIVLRKIPVPLPPLPEQKAIAQVLSDTDNLIQAIERKLAKKRAIKQGAMQQLLTPKEDWEVKKLGDFLVYEQPTDYIVTDTEYNDNYDIPVLTAGKTFILGYTNEKFGVFKDAPVIIFDDFTTATKFVDFHFKVKSSAMKILKKKNDSVDIRFIYELMQQIVFPLGDHKRHWIGEYQHIEIKVPKPKEQLEIATILSDMDAEIAQIEQKLSKYKMLKQGLMQNLLTGKIRLVCVE
ncbi:restriction endonuclease subunit S [Namhaeicola litoreus]|uniref:Restriction endonuclease subunit S n=1 Tax=Namhaeicola litoreus TaxID=1052145 RepID=A0ABW3Y512_9FLAO